MDIEINNLKNNEKINFLKILKVKNQKIFINGEIQHLILKEWKVKIITLK